MQGSGIKIIVKQFSL